MKIFKNISLMMSLMLLSSAFAGCTSNDDDAPEVIDLKTYIIGDWHSYMATVEIDGQKTTVDVTDENHSNIEYAEIVFGDDSKATIYAWAPNWEPVTIAPVDKGSYKVNGDVVEFKTSFPQSTESTPIGFNTNGDSSGITRTDESKDVIMFKFDKTNKTLCWNYTQKINNKKYNIDLYFRK